MNRIVLILCLPIIVIVTSCGKKAAIEPEPPLAITDSSLVTISRDFEQELIRQGIDKKGDQDGLVRFGDVKAIDSLFIYGSHLIKSLKGIEHFVKLRSLTLYMTQQDSLDLSKNEMLEYLNCQTGVDIAGSPAALKYLNVTNCKKLLYLNCYNNLLTEIDVSKNNKLQYLNVGLNKKLTSLDLLGNSELEVFRSEGCWELARLDVSKNLRLKELYCTANYKLTSLDVSPLSSLSVLSCESNHRLTNLTLGSHSKLIYLNIAFVPIAAPNFTKMVNLSHLNIGFAKFSTIDLRPLKKLRSIEMYQAEMPAIDLSSNSELEVIDIGETRLLDIDLTHNKKLKQIYCQHQPNLISLDLRGKAIQTCLANNCGKLKTICVDKLPNPSDENWKISEGTKFEVCKD